MMRVTAAEHRARLHRARTTFLVVISLYIAYELLVTGAIGTWVGDSLLRVIPAGLIAGAFFTSLLTVVPATVVLLEVAQTFNPFLVAVLGGAGAVIGDLFLFLFVREAVSRQAPLFLKESQRRYLRSLFAHPLLHWLLPLCGAIIIASPLPDEFGLALMGLSRMDIKVFIPLSFTMNFIGIALLALAARSVV